MAHDNSDMEARSSEIATEDTCCRLKRQIKSAQKSLRKSKETMPYLFPAYSDYQAAKQSLNKAIRDYRIESAKWKEFGQVPDNLDDKCSESLAKTIRQASSSISKIKLSNPYLYPQYLRMQSACQAVEKAFENYRIAKEKWDDFGEN